MRTNNNHLFALQNHLTNAFLDSPEVMHPAESFALAHGLCRHFELDVSPVDILHAIVMAEEAIEEYFDMCGVPYDDDHVVECQPWPTVNDDAIPF